MAFAPEVLISQSNESVPWSIDPDFDVAPSRRSDNLAEKMHHLVLPKQSRIKAAACGSAEIPECTCLQKMRG